MHVRNQASRAGAKGKWCLLARRSYGRRSHVPQRCLAWSRTARVGGHGSRPPDTGMPPLSTIDLHLRLPSPVSRLPGEDEDVVQHTAQRSGQYGCTWTMAALVRTSKNLTHLLMCDRRNSKLTVEPRGRVACRFARNRGSHHPFCSSLASQGWDSSIRVPRSPPTSLASPPFLG